MKNFKNIKKLFLLVLCFTLFVGSTNLLKVFAFENSVCGHCGRLTEGNKILEYQYAVMKDINDTSHIMEVPYCVICTECGFSIGSGLEYVTEDHLFYTDLNRGHIKGINLHRYLIRCSKCGYSKEIEVPCLEEDCPG